MYRLVWEHKSNRGNSEASRGGFSQMTPPVFKRDIDTRSSPLPRLLLYCSKVLLLFRGETERELVYTHPFLARHGSSPHRRSILSSWPKAFISTSAYQSNVRWWCVSKQTPTARKQRTTAWVASFVFAPNVCSAHACCERCHPGL